MGNTTQTGPFIPDNSIEARAELARDQAAMRLVIPGVIALDALSVAELETVLDALLGEQDEE